MGGEGLRTDGKTHSELNTNLHSTLEVAVCQRLYCHQELFIRGKDIPSQSVFVRGKKTSARSDLQSDLTEYLHFQCALHIFSRIINPDIPDGRITNPTERRVSGAPEQTESTCLSVHICAQRSFRVSPCLSVAKCQLLYCYLFFALFVVDTTYYSYLCGDINKKSLGKGHYLSINNNCIAP